MATILFANNASSTLAGPLTGTAATLNVAAGTGVIFPQPSLGQYFCLTLTDAASGLLNEILHVTAINGDTFTIQRGQENTAPQAWLAGDLADNLITAGSLTAFAQSASITSGSYQGFDTGTSPNAVIVTSTVPALSAPVQGQYFQIVKSGSSNTGPVTCRIGSGGEAASVVYKDGTALGANAWPANAAAILYFTGGVYQFVACQGAPRSASPNGGLATDTNNNFLLAYMNLVADNRTAPVANDVVAVERMSDGTTVGVSATAFASYVLSNIIQTNTFPRIFANQTVYIRSDGSDSNTGMANTAASAFLTPQGAINYVQSNFVTIGQVVTFQFGTTGVFPAPASIPLTGSSVFRGDPANQGSYVLTAAGSASLNQITAVESGAVTFIGLTHRNTGSQSGNLSATAGGTLQLINTTVSCTASNNPSYPLVSAASGGTVTFNSGVILIPATTQQGYAMLATGGGAISIAPTVVTLQGDTAFQGAFASAQALGSISVVSGGSVSGTATGSRYLVSFNGVIDTQGGGPNFFPGSLVGVSRTGGQYD